MTLADLKATVAAIHGKEITALSVGGTDLFLVAANNARKNAEKLHNFQLARCTATLDIDGVTGGALADAEIAEDAFGSIKEVIAISAVRQAGDFIPLDFTRADIQIERDRYELELSDDYAPTNRYPSDADRLARRGAATLVIRGGTIFNFPRVLNTTDNPLHVYIEGFGWLNDYTDADLAAGVTDPKDFFIEHGFSYMQWAIVIEMNYMFQTFVARQEGNVGMPTDMLKEAWRDLLLWDTYQDVNFTRSS